MQVNDLPPKHRRKALHLHSKELVLLAQGFLCVAYQRQLKRLNTCLGPFASALLSAAMNSSVRGLDEQSKKKDELPRRTSTDLNDLPRAFTERVHELSTLSIRLVSSCAVRSRNRVCPYTILLVSGQARHAMC